MIKIILAILAVLLLAGCVAGPNTMVDKENPEGNIAGFWHGLLHGLLAPIMFIVSLFNKQVNVYEVFNNGGWYNFGFLLGVSMTFGGGGAGACSSKKNRD